jgi:hypothetical protein
MIKQTAVDLMYARAIFVLPMDSIDARRKIEETYLEAKKIEKEQILQAHIVGQPFASCQSEKAEQYYNENY